MQPDGVHNRGGGWVGDHRAHAGPRPHAYKDPPARAHLPRLTRRRSGDHRPLQEVRRQKARGKVVELVAASAAFSFVDLLRFFTAAISNSLSDHLIFSS